MKPIAVIFDMDGVIAHTNPYHKIAFKRFFDRYGAPYTDAELEEHMYGKHNSYIMSYFLKRELSPDEINKLSDEKEALFREIYAGHCQELVGFSEFLDGLKQAGIKTAVGTSAPTANLKLVMDKLGFEAQMESILASEDVTHHKPHPEVYQKSMANLGVEPSQSVVFEDSSSGILAAKAAGAKVVGVLSSHLKEELPSCQTYIQDFRGLSATFVIDLLERG